MTSRSLRRLAAGMVVVTISAACGRKGPPLPPLVRVPTPPADIVAERRGDTVGLRFVVPNANTDGSRPANIKRIDVFALSGPLTMTAEEIVSEGERVASLDIKAPRDPDDAVEAEDPDGDIEEPEGKGLDQGSSAEVSEVVAGLEPGSPPKHKGHWEDVPALCPAVAASRSYVAVGLATNGRRGPGSRRVTVPLTEAPPAPAAPSVTYDETVITVSWPPASGADPAAGTSNPEAVGDAAALAPRGAGEDTLLESRTFTLCPTRWAYHVYERPVAPPAADDAGSTTPAASDAVVRLTMAPVEEPQFEDKRVEWGVERCYMVGAVQMLNDLAIESERSEATCATFRDTFAPATPEGLRTVASQGAINLIWNPVGARDLGGYLVLRGTGSDGPLEAITPAPVTETSYRDTVPSGRVYRYAVQAVDRDGNVSAASAAAEDTAR